MTLQTHWCTNSFPFGWMEWSLSTSCTYSRGFVCQPRLWNDPAWEPGLRFQRKAADSVSITNAHLCFLHHWNCFLRCAYSVDVHTQKSSAILVQWHSEETAIRFLCLCILTDELTKIRVVVGSDQISSVWSWHRQRWRAIPWNNKVPIWINYFRKWPVASIWIVLVGSIEKLRNTSCTRKHARWGSSLLLRHLRKSRRHVRHWGSKKESNTFYEPNSRPRSTQRRGPGEIAVQSDWCLRHSVTSFLCGGFHVSPKTSYWLVARRPKLHKHLNVARQNCRCKYHDAHIPGLNFLDLELHTVHSVSSSPSCFQFGWAYRTECRVQKMLLSCVYNKVPKLHKCNIFFWQRTELLRWMQQQDILIRLKQSLCSHWTTKPFPLTADFWACCLIFAVTCPVTA